MRRVAVLSEPQPVLLDLAERVPVRDGTVGQRQRAIHLQDAQVLQHPLVQRLVLVVVAGEQQEGLMNMGVSVTTAMSQAP